MKLDVEVVIIKPGIGFKEYNEFYFENIRVVEYPESEIVDRALQTGKRDPDGLPAFRKLLATEQPDVLHVHEITGSNGITMAHVKVAKELSIPVFATLHLIGYTCPTGMLFFKDSQPCNGIVETYKCSVCTLHNKGFQFGTAEVLSRMGQWFQKNQIDTSFLPAKLSGVLSYPLYTDNRFQLLTDLFASCEKVFVLSDWFKKLLVENNLSENKMVLLPKALPDETVSAKKRYQKREQSIPVKFVYVGRISSIKGLHTVLEALRRLDNSNWSFEIYGQVTEDDYFLQCKRIIKDISGAVEWKGVIDPKDVVNTVAQYDALIFPTIIQEMVGLVVQEAFAAGVPVIGSNVKGIAEQVTDKVDGLLFQAGDAASLQSVLNEVITNELLLAELAANIKPPRLFKDVALQTLEVYESILPTKASTVAATE